MPFKSKSQQRFMFSQHPEMAKEWADKTPDIKKLPEHVKKMAKGGEAFNPPNGDFEAIKAALTQGKTQEGEPGLQDASVSDFVGPALAAMTGGASDLAEAAPEMLGNEAGEFTLGKAPEMEGMAIPKPDVEVVKLGIQKGGSEPIQLYTVKGKPEEVAKLGFGTDPASIPEHILKQHGLLPDSSINMPGQSSPNSYAQGGEVVDSADKEFHSEMRREGPMMGIKPQGYADGGDVTNAALNMLGAAGIPGLGDIGMIKDMVQGAPAVAQAVTPPQPPVDQNFINQLNAGTALTPSVQPQPQTPSLSQVAQNIQQTPNTDYSLFKGISAEDRANLYKQLLAQKSSPGNLVAKGVAGLGDAVSNSFGRGGQNTLGNMRETENQNVQNQIGAIDTERQQKMQDIQGNIALQEADPNSPYSQGMRYFLQSQGMKVPSGMSAAMLKSTLPDVTKIFDAKMQAITAQGTQGVEAGKALMGETFTDWLREQFEPGAAAGEAALEQKVGGTAPANTNGWKVIR